MTKKVIVDEAYEGTLTSPKPEHSEEKVKRVLVMAIVLVTTTKTTNLKRLYYYKKDSE